MGTVPHMDRVREHLEEAAGHHRRNHQEALRAAAVVRAHQEAQEAPEAPQTGLQGPEEGFWSIGAED